MDYKIIFTENGLTNIDKFFNYMQNKFEYGWIDKDGNKHYGINDAQSYNLQSPKELLKSHIGICWDMTELYRCFFENMTRLKYETYYLLYDNNKVYWFEPMFNEQNCFYSGIHEYDNITKLLEDLKNTFTKSAIINELIPIDYNPSNIKIYKYTAPSKHINGYEMRDHINSSKVINIG